MNKIALSLLASLLLIASLTHAQPAPAPGAVLTPLDAIHGAADDPMGGVSGVFEFEVRCFGKQGRFMYLNSEQDYRDQRCLTIRMTRGNAALLEKRIGMSLKKELIGQRIRVRGTARRTKIYFTSFGGRATGLYYYQTHVYVDDPEQIQLVPAN